MNNTTNNCVILNINIWQTHAVSVFWLVLSQDFAGRTVSMETAQPVYFCFAAKPADSKFATKTAKKKKPVNIVILHIEATRRS